MDRQRKRTFLAMVVLEALVVYGPGSGGNT